jgi:hypothetical protein
MSKTNGIESKTMITSHFLKEKNFGQNFEFSAHSGGCNLVKITFYLVFSHCGSNPNIKYVKNLLKVKNFLLESQKYSLWADFYKTALTIFF